MLVTSHSVNPLLSSGQSKRPAASEAQYIELTSLKMKMTLRKENNPGHRFTYTHLHAPVDVVVPRHSSCTVLQRFGPSPISSKEFYFRARPFRSVLDYRAITCLRHHVYPPRLRGNTHTDENSRKER